MQESSLMTLLRKVHEDEEGTVSLETILILGMVALPVLILLLTVGWPFIKDYFLKGIKDVTEGADEARD